jgi:virulence-associated protein VagC
MPGAVSAVIVTETFQKNQSATLKLPATCALRASDVYV